VQEKGDFFVSKDFACAALSPTHYLDDEVWAK